MNYFGPRNPILWDSVQSLCLAPIKEKLCRKGEGHEWTLQFVAKVETLYKQHLYLIVAYPTESIVPCKTVDEFWHAHILDTVKYAADCDAIAGTFIHHFPYFGLRGDDDAQALQVAFSKTQLLSIENFGINDLSVFDLSSCSGDSTCSDKNIASCRVAPDGKLVSISGIASSCKDRTSPLSGRDSELLKQKQRLLTRKITPLLEPAA